MRRSGLKRAHVSSVLGALSVLAWLAGSSAAYAETGSDEIGEAAAGEAASGPPAATEATATAAASDSAAPEETVKAAAPSSANPPPDTRPASLRSNNAGVEQAKTTRYSRRHSGVSSSANGEATPGGAPAVGEVVCRAGCASTAGDVVYTAFKPQTPPAVQDGAKGAGSVAPEVTCVAGCTDDNSTKSMAAIETGYMTTEGKIPARKAVTSGEWMVKINRERGR